MKIEYETHSMQVITLKKTSQVIGINMISIIY